MEKKGNVIEVSIGKHKESRRLKASEIFIRNEKTHEFVSFKEAKKGYISISNHVFKVGIELNGRIITHSFNPSKIQKIEYKWGSLK
jgi:hypothetical protein